MMLFLTATGDVPMDCDAWQIAPAVTLMRVTIAAGRAERSLWYCSASRSWDSSRAVGRSTLGLRRMGSPQGNLLFRNEVATIPRSREQLQQGAADAERWLDSLDPAAIASPDADAGRLRRVANAVRSVANDHVELAEAVTEARKYGHTWTQVAAMLGTSRQAAQERFGDPTEGSCSRASGSRQDERMAE